MAGGRRDFESKMASLVGLSTVGSRWKPPAGGEREREGPGPSRAEQGASDQHRLAAI